MRQVAVEKGSLQLEADQDVQVVSRLIGPDTDERRLDGVDREMELIQRHVRQRTGEDRPSRGKEVLPERSAAADGVLPQPRLRLVQSQRQHFAQRRAVMLDRQPLFVQTVADLVQDAEEAVAEVVLGEARRDAIVAGTDGAEERMRRRIEPAAAEVEAHRLRHRFAEGSLPLDRERSAQHRGAGPPRTVDDGVDQRHQFAAQGVEEDRRGHRCGARLVALQERIVQVAGHEPVLRPRAA